MSVTKSAFMAVALLAGTAVVAQAQTNNVAALPPGAAPIATAPSYGTYPGPQPGGSWAGVSQQTQAVVPSPQANVGPAPGAGTGTMPPHFQKSADWEQNTAMHPYTSGEGPRAH
jgi:hypothetical protein